MKKVLALLVAAAFAASPVMANAKPKKTAEELEKERIAKEHDNTYRAVRDALPLVLPSWSLPIFFGTGMDKKLSGQDDKAEKKTKKVKATAQ